MIKIAVVEDDEVCRQLLTDYIHRFQKEKNEVVDTEYFVNGLNFIEEYTPDFDIVLMDIEMPLLNGLDAARKLREKDKDVCLIFITAMAQYAINGYEVSAMDFIVKPVSYFNFFVKLEKALRGINKFKDIVFQMKTDDGIYKVLSKEIRYIEVIDHDCYMHTTQKSFKQRTPLSQLELMLRPYGFLRCSHSYLLNPAYVTKLSKNIVVIDGKEISISKSRRKVFLEQMVKYMGETI